MTSFLIGPVKDGLRKDVKPWAIPEDAFETMTNAYQYRGRVVRRSGYTKLGRLANGTPVMGLKTKEDFALGVQTLVAFDTTQAYEWNGTTFINLPSIMPVTWSGTDYQFFWTTNYAGAFWATNGKPGLNGVVITGITQAAAPLAQVTTATPHGFSTGQTVTFINVQGMTQINGLTDVITVTGANTFTLNTISTNAFNAYVSGGFALNAFVTSPGQDGIRYYGALNNGNGWANYNPPIDPNNALAGALMIFPYRGYLVFLNTQEGNDPLNLQSFPNRARWTQIGTPYYSFPVPQTPNIAGVDPETARDDLFGKGAATDAPTNEAIVSAGFIRDILVVYFERSTWRLRFIADKQNPFIWERVNVELGSSCTYSSIVFDKGLMTISNRGIAISDGNDTSRFDEKIPDEIFNIRQKNNGFLRVQGIRTFRTRLNYWTYPSSGNPNGTYPDQVLVFNYDTKTWSFFDDCFTTFGYFYQTGTGKTWNDLPDPWSSYTDVSWNSGVSQQGYESIVAGNQQGYVLQLEVPGPDNDPSLAITAIANGAPGFPATFTSPNNNLPDGTWITLTGVTGTTGTDFVSLNNRNYKVSNPSLDPNNFILLEFRPINGGNAIGATYSYTIGYVNLLPGSIQINIGSLVFTDPRVNGKLVEATARGAGTIDYSTGLITLNFNPPIGVATAVAIRIVSLDPSQGLGIVQTTGIYGGLGEITKISGIDIQTKIFNFFNEDQRSRLSKIDFYVDSTQNGQFTCNVFPDSSANAANIPLPDNFASNVVLTTNNPYQISQGDETIYRLYCDVLAQTVQLQFTLTDAQLATTPINASDIQILAMMITMRRGGRVV